MQIIHVIPTFAWLILSAIFFGIGEYLSKKFALQPSLKYVIFVLAAYILGTLAWLPAILKDKQLSTTGTGWLLLSMMATLGIGLLVFHERLNILQIVGIVLAIFSMFLLNYH
jgi:drug/metabolite transporter (DMT)-like permease